MSSLIRWTHHGTFALGLNALLLDDLVASIGGVRAAGDELEDASEDFGEPPRNALAALNCIKVYKKSVKLIRRETKNSQLQSNGIFS